MNSRNQLLLLITLALIASVWYMRYQQGPITPDIPETLVVGTTATYPPFTFVQENGEITGFDIDVIKEVSTRIKMPITIKDMAWDALIPGIQLGSIHVIASDMTPTPERAERVLFSKPYFTGDPLIIVTRAESTEINGMNDLKNKKVVVNQGYFADIYVSDFKELEVTRLATLNEGFLALQAGRVDAFITARIAAQQFFDKHGTEKFRTVTIDGAQEMYALGISKKYPELLEKINNALDAMEKENVLQELEKKWGVQ